MTIEENQVLKERLSLIFKVNIAIVALSVIWFFSVFFTIRNFGSNMWLLLALFPSLILLAGAFYLYYAGGKIRSDHNLGKIAITSGKLSKLYFKKKGLRARYFIDIDDEKSFEIDERAFNQLNGHVNCMFSIHFAQASSLVFRIERIG